MTELQLHPGSEPLPPGGAELLLRLRAVLGAHLGDQPSDGWWVAIDTRRRGDEALFSVVVWQQEPKGRWRGEPFMHTGGPGLPVEERFAQWLAERKAAALT